MPRPRFTLRTLLVVVAICAVAMPTGLYVYRRPPHEVCQVRLGMTHDEVFGLFRPAMPMIMGEAGGGDFTYQFDWGRLNVHFPPIYGRG